MKLYNKLITNYTGLGLLWLIIVGVSGCKKLVEVNAPVTSLSSANIYSTDPTAIAAVNANYTILSNFGPFARQFGGISGIAGLSADELTLYSGTSDQNLKQYYKNALANNTSDLWTTIYPLVFRANAALEGLSAATSLTPAVKQQLTGEAKFCRAFIYFYLVNLYGDVPLVLTTDYSVNNLLARTPKDQVWKQIIQDLHDAEILLNSNYPDASLLSTSTERVRPTKWAAAALLARAYLYTSNWTGADSATSAVIGNSLYRLTGLDTVFKKNSNEAIWQLQPVNIGYNTLDAYFFILPTSGPNSGTWVAYLSDSLITHFEIGDQRRTHWVNSVTVGGATYYYPYKYKVNTNDPNNIKSPSAMSEYRMVLRLAEQYLIRAEARAQLNNLPTAKADLDVVRTRAGLLGTTANSQAEILAAILIDRRMELFTEWGQRWLDLKRTGTVNAVMGTGGACAVKGGIWNTNWQWYPIPLGELKTDPNLIQNPGYN
jgi:hypothetical protein